MSDAVPVADAMEEAQAVLDAETLAVIDAAPTEPAAPVQVPLFEPPPFDFEEAYDALHRLDLRAKNRKAAWESLKGATRDAKEDYDSAINDLHDKFDEIDSARRVDVAVRQAGKPAPTTEGGDPQMSEAMEQTIEDPQETQGEEVPDEPKEPDSDAPAA